MNGSANVLSICASTLPAVSILGPPRIIVGEPVRTWSAWSD